MWLQHTSLSVSRSEKGTGWSSRSLGARCRNSIALCSDETPHIGNYRLLKTIGKGNFAKVKLARHILTGREVGLMRTKKQKQHGASWNRVTQQACWKKRANMNVEEPQQGRDTSCDFHHSWGSKACSTSSHHLLLPFVHSWNSCTLHLRNRHFVLASAQHR